jgi:hypothetical protein
MDPITGATPPAGPIDPATLKSALKAFRKRLKVVRLDDESGIGSRAMTGGKKSGIAGIVPPNQFPRAVWDELVKQGKLRSAGQGLYELVEP